MNVPKLRFKDDDGREFTEWESDLIGNFSEFIQSGKSKVRNENGDFVLYGSTGKIGFCNKWDYQGKNILIARVGANAGFLYEIDGNYCVSDNTLILHLKKPNNYSFFCNLLKFLNLNKLVFGSGQPLITGSQLKNLNVFVPTFQEQTKIANFLTAIDEKITQLTQKHDILKQYKKGVMQQIFSQKLRFKDEDGREFPEWEERSLGEVVENNGGTALEEFVSEDGTHNFISIGNYEKDGHYFDNGQRIVLNPKTKLKLLNAGDLVMVLNDKTSSGDLIGATILVNASNKYIYNQRSERLTCKTGVIQSKYIWHFLNSHKFRKTVFSISQGGTQIYVNFPAVKKLMVPVPTILEQTKIANFLTAIDDKITHTQTQLNAVKLYKKGLLQQLFV